MIGSDNVYVLIGNVSRELKKEKKKYYPPVTNDFFDRIKGMNNKADVIEVMKQFLEERRNAKQR